MTVQSKRNMTSTNQISHLKMYDAFGSYLYKYRYIGCHVAVRPFKRDSSSGRFFKKKSPDTAGYFKSIFEPYVWKNTSNKIMNQIFTFLIILTGLIAYIYIRSPMLYLFYGPKSLILV